MSVSNETNGNAVEQHEQFRPTGAQERTGNRLFQIGGGGILGALCGAVIAGLALIVVAFVGERIDPSIPWLGWGMIASLVGAAIGAILGAHFQAANGGFAWMRGGCLGGMTAVLFVFVIAVFQSLLALYGVEM